MSEKILILFGRDSETPWPSMLAASGEVGAQASTVIGVTPEGKGYILKRNENTEVEFQDIR